MSDLSDLSAKLQNFSLSCMAVHGHLLGMRISQRSESLFNEALKWIPGGVNSPVRAFRAVGGTPFFVDRAAGATVTDVDGNEYVDYVGTWGPAILGHAHPKIVQAIQKTAEFGTSFGIPNPLEVQMAKTVCEAVPSLEQVRMCNSGTEATMSAIRIARGSTGRDKIIKFEGCYHGHVDSLLVKAGSGALTLGAPDSAGVPASFVEHTILLPFNDLEAVKKTFEALGSQIAGIILEPVPANAGLYLPKPGFLEGLKELTEKYDSVLIFDEVMTGFRLSLAGVQGRFGMDPDLSCFGKIIGGGLPVGAFGGKKRIMDCLAQLEEGMRFAAKNAGVAVTFQRIGSMFCGYFTDQPVHNLSDAMNSDREKFGKYFHGMMEEGIYLAPSQFEAGFISLAHTEDYIQRTVRAAEKVMKSL